MMKINSVYISAFGKFSDKTFDFTDGLNIIYGENEDGKTTLMTFIRMMFYGSNAKSNDPLYYNPRKKYLPRNDKTMAGSIDFTFKDRKYRIERIFKATNSADKITVTDLATGDREAFTGKDDLGKRFIGLSAESADRSIFLSVHGAITGNMTAQDELNSRLSNLADTGNEDFSIETVTTRLEKARNHILTKTGRGGKSIRDKERLDELTLSLSEAKIKEQARKELALSIENQKAMLNDINQDMARLSAQIRTAEGGKRFAKLKELVDSVKTLDSVNQKLICSDGTEITNQLVSSAESGLTEYKLLSESYPAIEERYNKIEKEIEKLKETFGGETADEITQRLNTKKEQLSLLSEYKTNLQREKEKLKEREEMAINSKAKILPLFPALSVLSLLILASSFILTQFELPLLIVGGVLTFVFLVLTLFVRKKPKTDLKAIREDIIKTEEEITKNGENIEILNQDITALTTKEALARQKEKDAGEAFEAKYEEYKDCRSQLLKLKGRKEEIEKLLNMLSDDKKVSVKGMEIILFSHKSNLSKSEALNMKIAMLKKDLDDISPEEAEKELSNIPEGAISVGDLDDMNKRLIFKKQEAENLQQKIAEDSAKELTQFGFYTHPTVIEKEIDKLKETIRRQTDFCESLDIAASVMADAFAKVRESFGSALAQRTAEIFTSLTNGKYKNVNVSKNFDISVEETDVFGSNDWQSLSDGTIDQAYFALRLAVSEFLSKDGEKLPLILDDPFDRYDDKRSIKAMEFLKEYSKDSQTLIFTCHKLFTENNEFYTL
ncbi:MAG: hypothetical protein E7568_02415 [Ruminococcaceae bacterium]|nr:hypothetical protein [Oscillospiraceae bacterium]